MSETTKLQQVLIEKTAVEQESLILDHEQRQLETRATQLCESIIKEIRKNNTEKKKTISQLQSQINSFEAQLGTLSVSDVPTSPSQATEKTNEYPAEALSEPERKVGIIETNEIDMAIPSQRKKK